VTIAKRATQHALSALLQHQRRWDAYVSESARTLERLANSRTEYEYVSCHAPEAFGGFSVLHTRVVEASTRECERHMRKLDEEVSRLADALDGMSSAANAARAAVQAASATLGEEWARTDALFRTAPAARLSALGTVVADEHSREFELKRAIAADLSRAGYAPTREDAAERARTRTLSLASWIMQPGLSGLGDDSSEHCVRVLNAELL
jgi:hypothetical protein